MFVLADEIVADIDSIPVSEISISFCSCSIKFSKSCSILIKALILGPSYVVGNFVSINETIFSCRVFLVSCSVSSDCSNF